MAQASCSKSGIVKGAALLIMALLVLLPLANDAVGFLPERAPHGIAPAKPALPFSVEALMKRSWQKRLEIRAKKESGLWAPLLSLGNEIFIAIFGQTSAFYNGSVLYGREGYLFQAAHLGGFNRSERFRGKKTEARYRAFKELQDLLAERGKTLVLVLTPNLIALYPELVPDIFRDPRREARASEYLQTKQLLDRLGVQYVDTFAELEKLKSGSPIRFFTRSGSHWNDLGSCLALQAINSRLQELGGARFREFSCESWRLEKTPRGKDRDLVEIVNLFFPERFYAPAPYVDIQFKEPQPERAPRVLLVGTSYLFALSEHIHDWKLSSDQILYFYYRQWRRGGQRKFFNLRKPEIDWQAILDRDLILINVGVGSPAAAGYGFVEDALRAINKNSR